MGIIKGRCKLMCLAVVVHFALSFLQHLHKKGLISIILDIFMYFQSFYIY